VRDDATEGSAGHFSLRSRVHDLSLELVAAGELDMAAAFSFETKVDAQLIAGGVHLVVLDLARVDFVDSAGLGALLSVRDRASQLGIEFQLARVSDPVRRILDVTGIGDIAGN
jgi:anti-sigma B factor antagonist